MAAQAAAFIESVLANAVNNVGRTLRRAVCCMRLERVGILSDK